MKTKSLLIALDADGVLLHYNLAYGKIWEKRFGEKLEIKEKDAYHATTFWGVKNPPYEDDFWKLFAKEGWTNMEPMPGALSACQKLKEAGHRLVCVTSMPPEKRQDRFDNLIALGFPIDDVIATGPAKVRGANPKKEAIDLLQPDIFVDDELRKLKDLSCVSVLVEPEICPDSPNTGEPDGFLSCRVENLLEFAEKLANGLIVSDTAPEKFTPKKYLVK